MRAPAAVVVFARAPQRGRAKSRLVPALGEGGAARLAARLLARTLATARAARIGPVELHGAPRARHPAFVRHARKAGLRLQAQRGADLGARMAHAMRLALRRARSVILVGTDCPALKSADLRRAARALCGGCRAVLAPAEDGGYPLIGVRHVAPRLFEGMAWGGPQVFADTAAQLDALGWRWRRLRTLWDVDRPQDVARFSRHVRRGAGS